MPQTAGIVLATVTFVGIWWGHVGVRWVERHSARIGPPMLLLTFGGLALNGYALMTSSLTLGAGCSIIGITLLWDAFEIYRQQRRVLKGHAPANPHNPRHAAYMAADTRVTAADPLNRAP